MSEKLENELQDEDMTVDITLEDGTCVTCNILTILTVNEKDYIVLMPNSSQGDVEEGEVWIYRYEEDENDVNAEPVLIYIEDDDEYEAVEDAFEEYLDENMYDAMD